MKIRMTADSTCDLTPELIRKYDIGIAPLSVVIDGEVFHDGVDVTPRDIFRAAEAGKSVRTAAVNTFEYREFFREQLKHCDQLVHVCLGSGFSSCYSDAVEASREMDNVFVVDSRNLSTGSGLLVLDGLSMIRKGAEDGKAIAETLQGRTGLVNGSLTICAGAGAAPGWKRSARKCCISGRPLWYRTGKCIPAKSTGAGMSTI